VFKKGSRNQLARTSHEKIITLESREEKHPLKFKISPPTAKLPGLSPSALPRPLPRAAFQARVLLIRENRSTTILYCIFTHDLG